VTAECLNERNSKGIDIEKVRGELLRMKSTEQLIKINMSSQISAGISLLMQLKMCWANSKKQRKISIKVYNKTIENSLRASKTSIQSTDCRSPAIWDTRPYLGLQLKKVNFI
jgi:hypothetical protein